MIFAIKFKKYVIGTSIFGIVVDKLCNRKKPCLVILFKIDKDSKVGFHHIILSFSLTVHLWVKSGKESPLNTKEIA